jgi:hypothetical protein
MVTSQPESGAFDPAVMAVGETVTFARAWLKRTGLSRWVAGPLSPSGQKLGGVSLARSASRAVYYLHQYDMVA